MHAHTLSPYPCDGSCNGLPYVHYYVQVEAMHVVSFGSWRHIGATLPVTVSKLLMPSSPLRQYMFGDYKFGVYSKLFWGTDAAQMLATPSPHAPISPGL
jgi:hypothetical protein